MTWGHWTSGKGWDRPALQVLGEKGKIPAPGCIPHPHPYRDPGNKALSGRGIKWWEELEKLHNSGAF